MADEAPTPDSAALARAVALVLTLTMTFAGGCGGDGSTPGNAGGTSVGSSPTAGGASTFTTDAASTGTTATGSDETTFDDEAAGFSVARPSGWLDVPTDDDAYDSFTAGAPTETRALLVALRASAVAGPGSRFLFVRPDGGAAAQATLTIAPVSVEASIDEALQLLEDQGGSGTSEPAEVDGQASYRVVQRIPEQMRQGLPFDTAVQYWVPTRGGVLIIVLAGDDPALERLIESVRLA